jgi:hypothetical protein
VAQPAQSVFRTRCPAIFEKGANWRIQGPWNVHLIRLEAVMQFVDFSVRRRATHRAPSSLAGVLLTPFRGFLSLSLSLFLFLSSALAAPALAADSWSDTFADVASLDAMKTRVLVVAAADDADARAAEAAFAETLRSSGSTLVLGHGTTGSLAGLDDVTILGRTATIPVDVRVVVRVFDGAPPTAVVSAYKPDGGVLWAFSARRGERHVVAASTSAVVADKAAAAVLTVPSDRAAAVEKYEEEFLWIGTGLAISNYGAGTYDIVYQGKYKRQLRRAELYKKLGDKAVFEQVEDAKWWFNATGVAAAVASVITIGLGVGSGAAFSASSAAAEQEEAFGRVVDAGTDFTCSETGCRDILTPEAQRAQADELEAGARADTYGTSGVLLGIGASVTGGTALAIGLVWLTSLGDDPAVLTGEELRRHIEAYNLALAKRLGLNNLEGLPSGFSLPTIGGAPIETADAL